MSIFSEPVNHYHKAFLHSELGNPHIKSMVMASHVPPGTGRGYNSPG